MEYGTGQTGRHGASLRRILERKIVAYCSPTLRNIKPANLFTFCPKDSEGCGEMHVQRNRSFHRTASGIGFQPIPRRALEEALHACAQKLEPMGIRFAILAYCTNGPMVYAYRPDGLGRTFERPEVAALLASEGYDTSSLDACIARLSERLTRSLPSQGGSCVFPHEIGLFLGYPYEDVIGFIEHGGRDFLCLGCWKAYHDASGAKLTWARYSACTAHCEEMIDRGVALECIAVPGAFVEAAAWLPAAV